MGVRCQSSHCLADSGTHEGPYVARSQVEGELAEPETTCRWQLEPGRSDAAGARLHVTLEGDESRPDLSGDSSGARLSLSAAAERIASSLSGGYQEYKE